MTTYLKGFSEKNVRKIQEIGRDWLSPIPAIDKQLIDDLKDEAEYYFFINSRVNYSFAHQVAVGMEIANSKKHYRTGNFLIDDIIADKQIFLDSYK